MKIAIVQQVLQVVVFFATVCSWNRSQHSRNDGRSNFLHFLRLGK